MSRCFADHDSDRLDCVRGLYRDVPDMRLYYFGWNGRVHRGHHVPDLLHRIHCKWTEIMDGMSKIGAFVGQRGPLT